MRLFGVSVVVNQIRFSFKQTKGEKYMMTAPAEDTKPVPLLKVLPG